MAFLTRKGLKVHDPASTQVGGQALDFNFSAIGDQFERTAGRQVKFLSESGGTFDGVTDNTAAVQALHDLASGGDPITIFYDVPAISVSGIDIYGKTKVVAHGCTIKLRDDSNRAIIRNAHRSRAAVISSLTRSGTTATAVSTAHGFATNDIISINGAMESWYNKSVAITVLDANTFTYSVDSSLPVTATGGTITASKFVDKDICIDGGIWDGNYLNQNGLDTFSPGLYLQEADGTWIVGLQFFGVQNLTVRDVKVQNCVSFAIHTANVEHVRGDDVWIENNNGIVSQDGWHFNGMAREVRIVALRVSAFDDGLAFNADDGPDDASVSNSLGPFVGIGSIMDVIADVHLDNSLYGIRIMCRVSRIDQVTIKVSGDCRDYFVLVDGVVGPKSVSSITRSSTTATVTATAHGYRTGQTISITAADQSEYNGTHVVTRIDADTFTYTVSGSPTTPATGTILANDGNYGTVTIDSDVYCHNYSTFGNVGGVVVTNNIECLRVTMTRNNWTDNRSSILVKAGALIDQLTANLCLHETLLAPRDAQAQIGVLGRIRSLTATGNWYTNYTATGAVVYTAGDGVVDRACLSGLTIPATCTFLMPTHANVLSLVGGNPASSPSDEVVLSSATVALGATYANVGNLTLTFPSAGDYRIAVDARTRCFGSDGVETQLTLDGVTIANTERLLNAPASYSDFTSLLTWTIKGVAAGQVVNVQGKYIGASGPLFISDPDGRTVLAHVKLGY